MNANKNRTDKYDLIMVCDVGSYFMDPWEPSTIDMNKKGLTKTPLQLINKLIKLLKSNWWLWLIVALCAISLIFGFVFNPGSWIFIIGGAMAMLLLFAFVIKHFMNKLENEALLMWDWIVKKIPGFMKDKLKYLDNLKLRLIKRMIVERGTSALTMISNVFMKQLRRLNYNLFYTDEKLKNRRITTLIYELTEKQYKEGDSDEKEPDSKQSQIDNPGDRIYAAAKIASEMGTTLWFSEEDKKVHRLKNLVSCGQFTACYNLLKYCIDLKKSEAKVDQDLLDEMIGKFQADWKKFITNPYWLHDIFNV